MIIFVKSLRYGEGGQDQSCFNNLAHVAYLETTGKKKEKEKKRKEKKGKENPYLPHYS